jgi:predicted nucleic acid-binding protein
VKFLLDTNVVSNLRKQRPHPRLVAWLASVPKDDVFISAPTVTEVQCGICMTEKPARAKEVQIWLDGMLRDGFPSIVPFDAAAAVIMGRMWTTPSLDNFIRNDPRSRKRKSGGDLAVAACAIARGMTVVTNDVEDFLEIHAKFPLPELFGAFDGAFHVAAAAAAPDGKPPRT